MKNSIPKAFAALTLVALSCLAFAHSAFAQLNVTPPFSPGAPLTSYITAYPYANSITEQLVGVFLVDVTSPTNSSPYLNPPIPYGFYPAYCVDDQDEINAENFVVPGTLFSGVIYSSLDTNLNTYLAPLDHPNTIVSPAVWQEVNYILNNTGGYFYWDVQAAINTLVGSGLGYTNSCGFVYPWPVEDGYVPLPDDCTHDSIYPTFDPTLVNQILTNAAANSTNWVPQCGDVYGVIYVTCPTNNQIIIIELPIPITVSAPGGNLGCNPTPAMLPTTNSVLATVTNTPGTTVTVTQNPIVTSGTTCLTNTLTFTITAVCAGGNSATTNAVYTWQTLSMPPTLSGVPSSTMVSYTCYSLVPPTNGVTAMDACGNLLPVNYFSTESAPGSSCSNIIVRTWSATDCANQKTTFTETITVKSVPPTLTAGTIGTCYTNLASADAAALAAVKGSSTCGNTIALSVKDNGKYCPATITVTGTDSCGNTVCTNFTATILTAPPVFQGLPPMTASVSCYAAVPTAPKVTASDSCGDVLSVNYVTNESNPGSSCTNIITRTWTAVDCAGQQTNYTQIITVKAGPPSVTPGTIANCYTSLAAAEGAAKAATTASALCGSTPSLAVSTDGNTCPATITVKGTDACGNSSTAVYKAYILGTVPTFQNLPANSATNYTCYAQVPAPPTVAAKDACGVALTVTYTTNETSPGSSCNDVITRKWTATDCANQQITFTETITVKNTTLPVLSDIPTGGYLGCSDTGVPSDTTVSNEVKATASCGLIPTISVTHADSTNVCTGERTFKITATDTCGNSVSSNLVYTWTANGLGLTVMCPTNVTIVTNLNQMYCTFSPSSWGGSCNNNNNGWGCGSWGNGGWGNNGWNFSNWGNFDNNNWWQNWCNTNPPAQSWPSWTNWWANCGGTTQFTNFWSNWCSTRPTNWWGSWSGNNQYGQNSGWWTSWNCNNQQNYGWVPCAGNNPANVLTNCFAKVYTNGCVLIGATNGNHWTFTSCNAVRTCLNFGGNCGILPNCATNPTSCNSGAFCSQVLALKINCDFGDYGCVPGFVGKCGDLVLNCASPICSGMKVRDVLSLCNDVIGGKPCPTGCSIQSLCGLLTNLNHCFEGCQVSGWCATNLSAVYIPPVSQTGTATVEDACSPVVLLTNTDTVSCGSCSGTYQIDRLWIAVDACGNSNTCTQVITIAQSDSSSVGGVVVLACSGDNNLSNNQGIPKVTVTLKNSAGTTVATDTTDNGGNYSFGNLAPGSYTVVVTAPSGYTETYPSTSGNSASVTAVPCQTVTANFAYIGSTPGVSICKTAPCMVCVSNAVTYTFAVTNTGNTCETLQVIDPLLGGTIFSQTSVAPGAGFLFTSNYTAKTCGTLTNTAEAIGTAPNGKTATNYSTVTTSISTKCMTNSICSSFVNQNPGGGWLWCNAHLTCNPGKACNVYCQNASVTLTCNDGKTYTFPVPDCHVQFTNTSAGSCTFDGTKWTTCVPTSGDSQCFLSGCGIPWQSDFANCKSVCWTGSFSCDQPGVNCSWQWSSACYKNSFADCTTVGVKACQQTYCGWGNNNNDCAGTPENCKSYCQTGGCGTGGNNYCGSWSSAQSFTCK